MAELNRAGRYDRMADGVERVTGQPPMSVREFVSRHADAFGGRRYLNGFPAEGCGQPLPPTIAGKRLMAWPLRGSPSGAATPARPAPRSPRPASSAPANQGYLALQAPGPVAQWIEHPPPKRKVARSSRAGTTSDSSNYNCYPDGSLVGILHLSRVTMTHPPLAWSDWGLHQEWVLGKAAVSLHRGAPAGSLVYRYQSRGLNSGMIPPGGGVMDADRKGSPRKTYRGQGIVADQGCIL